MGGLQAWLGNGPLEGLAVAASRVAGSEGADLGRGSTVAGWVAQAAPGPQAGPNPFDFLYAPGSKWLVLWMGLSPFVLALLMIWAWRRLKRK